MEYPTIVELIQMLTSEHKDDLYLYRGQMERYKPHKWKTEQEERSVEALYPADYRFHYKHNDFSPKNLEHISRQVIAARAYGRTIRDQFNAFLFITLLA